MNKVYKLLLTVLISTNISSQENIEEPPSRAELIDSAIKLEASSSSAAASR